MRAIILAGGFGTRLRGIHAEPKCLIDIGQGERLLDHQVALLRAAGIADIRVSVHYKADEVRAYARKFGPGVTCVYEAEPLGTGGAIKLAARGLREPIVVANGDILTQIDFSRFIAKALWRRSHTLSVVTAPAKDFGNIELLGDRIVGFREKSGGEEFAYVSEGFYVLLPGIFEGFPEKFSIERDCFPRLAERGMLRAYIHGGTWLDVGTPERFAKRREMAISATGR